MCLECKASFEPSVDAFDLQNFLFKTFEWTSLSVCVLTQKFCINSKFESNWRYQYAKCYNFFAIFFRLWSESAYWFGKVWTKSFAANLQISNYKITILSSN